MKHRNIFFRVDASLDIGTGHVARCLTLADALHNKEASCHFICSFHSGNLISYINERGYKVHILPNILTQGLTPSAPLHASWLGCHWTEDAKNTNNILSRYKVDWLIVDHYSLDKNWERCVRPSCSRMMVIDDLADRHHDCDILLDQNLDAEFKRYNSLVPKNCLIITGPKYALLRPEFFHLRSKSLQQRKECKLEKILISMGGVDKDNATGTILEIFRHLPNLNKYQLTVVMGTTSPWIKQILRKAENIQCPVDVKINVKNMAELMCQSDLAIGASGSSSWERCCMGLPSLMVVLAENQKPIAQALDNAGVSINLGNIDRVGFKKDMLCVLQNIQEHPQNLKSMVKNSSKIAAGSGSEYLIQKLLKIS